MASLGLFNPALAGLLPITAGIAAGGMAEEHQRVSHEICQNGGENKRTLFQAFKHKLRKPDYFPARIDYYARIYAPTGFLLFNIVYWSVCLYKASIWKHPD
jgi:hypothetical protein